MEEQRRVGLGVLAALRGDHLRLLLGFIARDALNRAAARRIPARRRQLEARFGRQPPERLYQTLSEGRRAHEHGPVVILQRAGDDLRRARRPAVDDDDDGQARPLLWVFIIELVRGARCAPARRHNFLAGIEEEVRHRHTLVEEAAGVVAQIEDERLHPLLAQRVDRLRHFPGRVLAHRRQGDVSDAIVEHQRDARIDRPDVNRGARELIGDRLVDPAPSDQQLRRRPGRPAQFLDRLILLPPFRRTAVELDDAVARLHAGALGRRIGQRRDDGDPAVAHVDLNAEAGVVAGRGFGELAEVVRLEEYRVRIAQLIEHAVDRHLIELALVERIDVVIGDVGQHVVEQPRLLIDRAFRLRLPLQEPAAADQRGQGDDGDHGPFMTNHHAPLSDSAVAAATSRQAASWTAFLAPLASIWTIPGPDALRYASRTRV